MSTLLQDLLRTRDWLLADGATGTGLFGMGLPHGEAPEVWNLARPDRIRAHYRAFLDAGADIVLTNSFGGTANRLRLHGLADAVHEVNRQAAGLLAGEIARCGRPVACAGSVGPTGDLFEPLGPLTREGAVAAFVAQMEGLKQGGIDVVWIETMSSVEELDAAVEAARRVGIPACCTMSFDTNGRTMMGVGPDQLASLVHGFSVAPVAYGGNCGTGAPDLLAGLSCLRDRAAAGDILIAKANCGIPEYVDGGIRYSGTPELMAEFAVLARDIGVRIIGGCCGTTAEHLVHMRRALEEAPASACPTLAEIVARVGPLSGATGELLGSSVPRRRPRRGQGRKRTGSEAEGKS